MKSFVVFYKSNRSYSYLGTVQAKNALEGVRKMQKDHGRKGLYKIRPVNSFGGFSPYRFK